MKHTSINAVAADPELALHVRAARGRLHQLLSQLDELDSSSEKPPGAPASAERVDAILKARRSRSRYFDAELFADPAWDILLELYATELRGCRISVSSLCIGAGVPATTALRWIRLLEGRGLVVRTDDPTDGRRVFVALSDEASNNMDSLFRANPEAEPLL
jgi:DNA-binding MarR family transcriptional regulator